MEVEDVREHPPLDPELDELLRQARNGSLAALGALFEQLRPHLTLLSKHELDLRLQAKGGASDLVQQSFLEAHRDFHGFEGENPEQLVAWLKAILLSNIADFRRRFRGAAKRRVDNEVQLDAVGSGGGLVDGLAAKVDTPSKQLRRREQDEQLDMAIARLPEQYRTAIMLRNRDNLSFEEIGQRMNRTSEAARKCWSRAVQKLQQELEQDGDSRID